MNGFIENVTKVKKLERKIASYMLSQKKTIQFNNKWKSTDLKITVYSKDVCTEELLRSFFFIINIIIIIIIIFFFFGGGGLIYLFVYLISFPN